MPPLDPLRCLLLACRTDSADGLGAAAARVGERGETPALLALAAWHGLLGVLLARLEQDGLLPVVAGGGPGGPEGAALASRLRAMRIQAAILDLECDRVLDALTRAGVEVLLLKGAALRRTVYRQSVERPMGDLDLLVAPGGLDPAVRVLIAAGYALPPERLAEAYEQHHFHAVLQSPAGFLVELHWGLSRADAPFRLDAAEFLRGGTDSAPAGRSPARVPAPEDQVLHMASQNVEDSFSRLRRFVDLDRLIAGNPGLDWDRLIDRARAGGLRHVLAHSLWLTHRLLGTPIPAAVSRRIRPPLPTRAHLVLLRPARAGFGAPGRERAAATRLLHLWLIDGGRARLAELRGILRGTTDPMEWVWLHRPEPAKRRLPWVAGSLLILKLIAYQLWLYLEAALAPLRRARAPSGMAPA